ncbi:MAG: hypothetical protein J0L84_14565 [Verrucomicrobia bacterium]|nr:hypothetical protein [Verrucomicrobiota bacterium]
MKRLYYVDRDMCGDDLPADFDLDEFCEVLQGKLDGVEVVAATSTEAPASNRDRRLVPESVFLEALGEYLHR